MPTATAKRPAKQAGSAVRSTRATKTKPSRVTKATKTATGTAGQSEQQHDDKTKLQTYDDTYLECREMRHAWKLLGWFTNGALIIQHAQCQRCPTMRTKRYRRNGIIESTRYEYPEDYHLTGGVQGVSVRAEMIRRAVVWTNESEMLNHVMSNGSANGNRKGRSK